MKTFDPSASAPLDGVKVLDLSRLVCGNMLTVLLADFGADVVKVEDPGKGDPLRDWRTKGISAYWKVYGRNKRSLALDLRGEEGRAVLLDLVAAASIFVESFKTGTLERFGLDPAALHRRNPKLVVVRVSGWGQTGPYKKRPGFGTLVEAMSGFAAKTGYPDRPPLLPNMALADMAAGVYGAYAAMVALRHAEAGGKGQVIDLSLLEPLLSMLGADPAVFGLTGKSPPRTGSRSMTTAPRNVYATKDGRFVAISASMQSMAERVFAAIGRPELIDDPRFRTNTDRVANIEAVDTIVQDWIAARTQKEVLALFEAAEVTAGPVYDMAQLVEDEHVKAREIIVEMPDDEAGSILMHNIIPRLSETPGALRRPAPALGADSEAVLKEAGYDAARISSLIDARIIAAAGAKR
jgi:crotonobetainyl-CoA:carnitine CoA-transferase CaiB-like acyl-CoA transferase